MDTPYQASLKIALKTGGTAYESSAKTVTTSYADYSKQWSANPATGSAWTWDEIDNLHIGVSLRECEHDVYYTRCTQLYIEVEYEE